MGRVSGDGVALKGVPARLLRVAGGSGGRLALLAWWRAVAGPQGG